MCSNMWPKPQSRHPKVPTVHAHPKVCDCHPLRKAQHTSHINSCFRGSARHSSFSDPMAPKCETFVIFTSHGPKVRDIRQFQAPWPRSARHSSFSSPMAPKCETFVTFRPHCPKVRDVRHFPV